MDRKEAGRRPFRGEEYNTYEATQKQRWMETAMRAQREKVQLLKQGGADPDDVLNARCKYQAMLDEYKDFSKKFGLLEQRERIYADLPGRVAPSTDTYRKWQIGQAEKAAFAERKAGRAMRERVEMNRRADMDAAGKMVAKMSCSGIIKVNNKELPNGLPLKGIPGLVVDKVDDSGKTLQKRVYDEQGNAKIDFDTSDHGLPSIHPTGEHKHVFDYKRKNLHGKPSGLTKDELEQNRDIIKCGENYHEEK